MRPKLGHLEWGHTRCFPFARSHWLSVGRREKRRPWHSFGKVRIFLSNVPGRAKCIIYRSDVIDIIVFMKAMDFGPRLGRLHLELST